MQATSTETNTEDQAKVLDTSLRVTTPEKVSFQYQLVGPFRRLLSYGLDLIISIFLFVVISFVGVVFFSLVVVPLAERMGLGGAAQALAGILAGLWLIVYFIVYWFYGALMETYFNGQTFGKMLLRYRVLSKDGYAIDGVQAVLRNFFRLLDIMPVVPVPFLVEFFDLPTGAVFPTCLFGMIAMMISAKFQRLGDLVAGTIVVIEERKWTPELAKFDDERVAGLADLIPSGFQVSPSMSRALADYVEQRQYLPYLRAAEIANHLAKPLIEQFGFGKDTDPDLMLCSLYYKTFMQFKEGEPDEDVSEGMLAPFSVAAPVHEDPFAIDTRSSRSVSILEGEQRP